MPWTGHAGAALDRRRPMRERQSNDYYPTPIELCAAALATLDRQPRQILDAGAGDGNWGMAARSLWGGAHITGVELRDVRWPAAYDDWYCGDFLRFGASSSGYDLIVMNPPFTQARPFIQHAHRLLKRGGTIAALLRLGFLCSAERAEFWKYYPLHDLVPIVERPDFTGSGGDSTDYAFFVWRPLGDHPFQWIRWDKQRARQRIVLAAAGAVQESLL